MEHKGHNHIIRKLGLIFFSAKIGLAESNKQSRIIYNVGGKWARKLKLLSAGNPSFATSRGFVKYALEIRVSTLSFLFV